MFPGKKIPGGNKPILLFGIIILGIWLASGFYRVLPDEQGVVLRFGKYVNQTQPGLHYHLPFPVEKVLTPKVTKLIELMLVIVQHQIQVVQQVLVMYLKKV